MARGTIGLAIVALFIGLALPQPRPALAQAPVPAPRAAVADDLQRAIAKSNAYVQLLNRTLRGRESWNRYTSWVNVKTGPTGKERIIYGLYSLYDVKGEVEKARAAISAQPPMPALDAAIDKYIADYEAFAAVVAPMEKYYERKDYMADKMVEGKTFHVKIAPLAQAFLASRAAVEKEMATVKADLDQRELADIEKREGKAARWHMRHIMIETRRMVDLLPNGDSPVVNLAAFDAALERFAIAVKDYDAYGSANPGAFSTMDSRPGSYLGKLREFRSKIGRTKGDARRANAGMDLTWLINDYNMMVSMADMAARMRR